MKLQATQTDWKATRVGTTLSNLTLTGGTDRTYTAGAIVEQTPTARYAKDHYDWAMNQHSQTGAHTAVTATSLTVSGGSTFTGAVTLPNNSVDANELSTSAITLGYAQINTSNFTTAATSSTQVTGLTTTVTIPAGGRKIKITASAGLVYNSNAGATSSFEIWDGTVGSGTRLARSAHFAPANNTGTPTTLQAIVTPAAGSKTYNVGVYGSAGTTGVELNATQPAFILVEAI